MIIILCLSLLTGVFIVWAVTEDNDFAWISSVFLGMSLFITLITVPLNFYSVHGEIQEFNAVKATIETSRKKGLDVENAAFQMKIADNNKWLASLKYWNSTIFDIWIPDDVEKLKPLE